MFTSDKTNRGFNFALFKDRYNEECIIQKSSLASEDCIWLGIAESTPKILARSLALTEEDKSQLCGWVKYPVPDGVHINTRMHLTREQARELAKVLNHFADTGELDF